MLFRSPKVYEKIIDSKAQIARIQLGELEGALQMYSFDVGRFPTTAEGLGALVKNPSGAESWRGPYLKKELIPSDPWERAYGYKSPGDHGDFDLYSFGADGIEGNDDDVCNWK